jgi:hypothetical protein
MKSDSIAHLAAALSKAQAEIRPAAFNAVNPFLKNKYADLGSIIETAREPMRKHGLSVSQQVIGDGTNIGITTTLMHDTGEWLENTVTLPLGEERGKSQAQVAGSIITYLRRYSLAAVLGIYSDEDGDGSPAPAQAVKPAAQRQPAPAAQPTNGNGSAPMTLEEALAVTNSEGARYGDLPTDTLAVMANAISKAKEHKPEHDKKLLAIQTILKARKEQETK